MTALLQSLDGLSVHLCEKRREDTRTWMVRLVSYLVADAVASYRTDHFDGDNVEAVFEPPELQNDRDRPDDLAQRASWLAAHPANPSRTNTS